jgi:hypothetical protein
MHHHVTVYGKKKEKRKKKKERPSMSRKSSIACVNDGVFLI